MIPDEELFCLFEKASGPLQLSGKVDFVKEILRRYKAMGEAVEKVRLCVSVRYVSIGLVSVVCAIVPPIQVCFCYAVRTYLIGLRNVLYLDHTSIIYYLSHFQISRCR